jgi:hypothetical protein
MRYAVVIERAENNYSAYGCTGSGQVEYVEVSA